MITLLRTLTRKSPLKFGKYADCVVQHVLDMYLEGPSLLVWYYYNVKGISFNEDILNELGITDWLIIDKPGKNPAMVYAWKDQTLSEKDRLFLNNRVKHNRAKHKNISRNMKSGQIFSADTMRNRNQGNKTKTL